MSTNVHVDYDGLEPRDGGLGPREDSADTRCGRSLNLENSSSKYFTKSSGERELGKVLRDPTKSKTGKLSTSFTPAFLSLNRGC